jgi:hypothetical protein
VDSGGGRAGVLLAGQGRVVEGLADGGGGCARAQEIGSLAGISQSFGTLGYVYMMAGDYPALLEVNQISIAAATQAGQLINLYGDYRMQAWGKAGWGNTPPPLPVWPRPKPWRNKSGPRSSWRTGSLPGRPNSR